MKASRNTPNERLWTVQTGSQRVRVKLATKSPFKAAVAAVKTARFKSMGLLMQVNTKGMPPHYVSSERACKAAGMWGEK